MRGDRTGQAEGRHAVIPDAAIRVSMPRALDSAAAAVRPLTARLPMRRLLFDVKTVHAGTSHYRSARARRQRGGAVQARAQEAVGAVAGGSCGCVCGSVWSCGGVVCFGCGLSRRAGVRLSASAVVCPVVSVSGVVLSWVEILGVGVGRPPLKDLLHFLNQTL